MKCCCPAATGRIHPTASRASSVHAHGARTMSRAWL